MASGPEHYAKAERLLDLARKETTSSPGEVYFLAAAQVHATLALAAAAVGTERRAWFEVIGEPRQPQD